MVFNRNVYDARDKVVSAVSHLELELKSITSLYNKLQRDLELRTLGYTCSCNSNNNICSSSNVSSSSSNSASLETPCNDDITALLTLMKTTQLALQSITIRIDTLIYIQELLMLLERTMNVLNSIRSDIKRMEQEMQSIMQKIGTSFIESKIEFGYSERIELPTIDGYDS
ncbi:hypothetical protein HRbin04_00521 [archaeon HR04]|nr:hypothetical protein HRbin04_00521 [archaeon HR04]